MSDPTFYLLAVILVFGALGAVCVYYFGRESIRENTHFVVIEALPGVVTVDPALYTRSSEARASIEERIRRRGGLPPFLWLGTDDIGFDLEAPRNFGAFYVRPVSLHYVFGVTP